MLLSLECGQRALRQHFVFCGQRAAGAGLCSVAEPQNAFCCWGARGGHGSNGVGDEAGEGANSECFLRTFSDFRVKMLFL